MGLLQQAEKRKALLDKLTREKKKYIDHVGEKAKKVIVEGIREQRSKIVSGIPSLKKEKKSKESKVRKMKEKKVSSVIAEVGKEIAAEEKVVSEESRKEIGAKGKYILTGVPGFDSLLDNGIPVGNSIIFAGGAGSGKTIFCLQTLFYHASQGKKCLYITFEENEQRLMNHMKDFGWEASKLIKKGTLKIVRMNPFDITRNVDALLAKQKGELLIDIDPVLLPEGFKPEIVALDSLTAIASAFTGKEDSYRIYIEQLFRFFENLGSTNFLITETEQIPKIFSQTGVEEFLADGVVVLYNLKQGNVRENALEILKLRGAGHKKKIVAFQITGRGIIVYPEQEVFSEI